MASDPAAGDLPFERLPFERAPIERARFERLPIERLRIERRGGLAGLRRVAEHDGASLTDAERDALHGLLAAGRGGTAMRFSAGADRFSYRLQWIGPGGAEHSVDVPEDALPAVLAGLLGPALP